MNKLFIAFIALSILFCSEHIFSQGYRIDAKLKGLKDSVCYLTYYYENLNYIQDSAKINANGELVFQGKKALEQGLYNLMIGHWQSIDLLVVEQHFSIEADAKDLFNTLKFKGSRENDLFYSYQQKIIKDAQLIASIGVVSDSLLLNKQYALQYELELYKKKFIKAFEGTYAAKLIKATMPMDLPVAPKLDNGSEDPLWANQFFVEHYFDNYDLSDPRMIRTPYLYQAVGAYFEQLYFLPTDSLNHLVDKILAKTQSKTEIRKYLVTKMANFFENSKTMGHDAVFVYIMQNYYLKEPQMWDETTIKLVKERVYYLDKLLIGRKIPNVTLSDFSGKELQLHQINAKCTFVYIYSADCGHCQQFTPQLVELAQKYANKGLKVFAPIFGNDLETWQNFVKQYKMESFINTIDRTGDISFFQEFDAQYTPTIYIIDAQKKIVGKGNITIKNMEEIVRKILL